MHRRTMLLICTPEAGTLNCRGADHIDDFKYGVSFNLSDYRSKMGYMADRQNIGSGKITEEGSYYNEWYGYKSLALS